MAGSGSARKKRVLVLSAGATTSTSASFATSSPTALLSASADTASETSARILFAMRALYRRVVALKRPAGEADREHQLHGREPELQRPLRQRVGEQRAAHHPGQRQQPHRQPVAHPQVAVAALAQRADDRHRDDRHERRGLGAELRLGQEEDQAGHEDHAPADAEQAARHAGREADYQGADDVDLAHRISSTDETMRSAANNPAIARVGIRCCIHVPASTPPTAGTPTSRPLSRSALPSSPWTAAAASAMTQIAANEVPVASRSS